MYQQKGRNKTEQYLYHFKVRLMQLPLVSTSYIMLEPS